MSPPRKVRTAEEAAARREARRAAERERDLRRRSDPGYLSKKAADAKRRRQDPGYAQRERIKDAARKRARRSQPGVGRAEYKRRKARASSAGGDKARSACEFLALEFGHSCKLCV